MNAASFKAHLLSLIGAWLLMTTAAFSQVTASRVEIPVAGSKCNARVKDVSHVWGELRVPNHTKGALAVVVLLHSNAGIVGVGDFYARALNAAGIATLEVDSFTPRDVRNGNDRNAPVLCDRMQDAWGALARIAKDDRFNPKQVGVAGFSSGAAVAIMAGMGVRPARVSALDGRLPPELVFAAHFALYPACANIMDDPQRIRSWIDPGRPQNWGATGKPIHIVSGTQDDFDTDPKTDCLRMAKAFPAIANQLSVRMVDDATHAFDWPNPPPPSFNPFAKAQTGGTVTMRYSAKDAAQTQQELVDFFKLHLK